MTHCRLLYVENCIDFFSSPTVAVVPSLEAGDMLLMHGVAEQSTTDEPHPSSEVAPPTTTAQPVSMTFSTSSNT